MKHEETLLQRSDKKNPISFSLLNRSFQVQLKKRKKGQHQFMHFLTADLSGILHNLWKSMNQSELSHEELG